MEIQLDQESFETLVASEVDGRIAPDDLARLEAEPHRWAAVLRDLVDDLDDALERVAQSDRKSVV